MMNLIPYQDIYYQDLQQLYTDPELYLYRTQEHTDESFGDMVADAQNDYQKSDGLLGIKCILLDDQIIGAFTLFEYQSYMEIGIIINKNYQAMGLGTQAVQLLLQLYLSNPLFLERYTGFYMQTDQHNIGCQKLFTNLGFHFIDIRPICCQKHLDYCYIYETR